MNTVKMEEKKIPRSLILLLAVSCGLIVANLYYSQPLVGPIREATGISAGLSGLIVTMTQLGYAAAVLLDMAVSGNLVLGQQAIYSLVDEIRGRVNGLFMAVFFLGGAAGSALGGWAYAQGSWNVASILGLLLPVLAFLYYLTEKK